MSVQCEDTHTKPLHHLGHDLQQCEDVGAIHCCMLKYHATASKSVLISEYSLACTPPSFAFSALRLSLTA